MRTLGRLSLLALLVATVLACQADRPTAPPPAATPPQAGTVKSLLDRQKQKLEDVDRRALERQYMADQAEGGQQPPGGSTEPEASQ